MQAKKRNPKAPAGAPADQPASLPVDESMLRAREMAAAAGRAGRPPPAGMRPQSTGVH